MIGALPKGRCNRELSQTCLQGSPWRCRRKRRQRANSTFPPSPIQAAKLCLLGGMGSLDRAIGGLAAPSKILELSPLAPLQRISRHPLQIRFGGIERRAADRQIRR